MKSFKENERGMVIVEASIVFPIMFLVIFVMLSLGNAYWQKSRIEAIVVSASLEGAAYCADPLLLAVEEKKSIPSPSVANVYPYKYFDPNGVKGVKDAMEKKVKEEIDAIDTGLFAGMVPHSLQVEADFNNGFIYSTYFVEVSCEIQLPFRLLGMTDAFCVPISIQASAPVSDSPEFIRTVDMVEDYMESTGIMDKIDEVKQKLAEKINAAKAWFKK